MAERRGMRRSIARGLVAAAILAVTAGAVGPLGGAPAGAEGAPVGLHLDPGSVVEYDRVVDQVISVQLDHALPQDAQIALTVTAATTATAGSDYTWPTTPVVVVVPAGSTAVPIPLHLLDDHEREPDEQIVLTATITTGGSSYPVEAPLVLATTDGFLERNVTLVAPSATITLGDPIPTGLRPVQVLSDAGPIDLSLLQPTCSTTATAASPSGTYPITCTGVTGFLAVVGSVTSVDGTLRILPRLLVTPPSLTVFQGQPIPALQPTYTSAGAPVPAPLVPATCTTTATSTSPVGSYPVTCAGAADATYGAIDAGPDGVLQVEAPLRTTLTAAPVLVGLRPFTVTFGEVSARLVAGADPVVGRTVRFASGGQPVCTAVTDTRGVARCAPSLVTFLRVLARGQVTAAYAGEPGLLASAGTAGLVG